MTDLTTQLLWQRAAASVGGGRTWEEARTYCAGLCLGGLCGWRLPTLVELESIADYGQGGPAVFSATSGPYFWSGSTSGQDVNRAWIGPIADLYTYTEAKTSRIDGLNIRCVRCAGGPCPVPTAGPGAPPGHYVISADTVLDTKTTLTWQRNPPVTPSSWPNAGSYCAGLSLSGTGWRLPNIKELQSLVDVRACVGPAIDTVAFPGTQPWYWSSSPNPGVSPPVAWVVNFSKGSDAVAETAANVNICQVRCVR